VQVTELFPDSVNGPDDVLFLFPRRAQHPPSKHFPGLFNHLLTFNITIQVMAVADMSAGDQHSVRPGRKGLKQKTVIHPSGAHDADQAHIGWILQPGYPGQIGPGIGTPVADKGHNF